MIREERTELELLKMIAVLAAVLVGRLEQGQPASAPGVISMVQQIAETLDRLDQYKRQEKVRHAG